MFCNSINTKLPVFIGISIILFSSSLSIAQENKKKRPSPPSIQWVNQPKPSQVNLPPNSQHLCFQSNLVKQEIGFCIYLPPNYLVSQKRYPVIYTLHGNGGNEFTCLDSIALLPKAFISCSMLRGTSPKIVKMLETVSWNEYKEIAPIEY